MAGFGKVLTTRAEGGAGLAPPGGLKVMGLTSIRVSAGDALSISSRRHLAVHKCGNCMLIELSMVGKLVRWDKGKRRRLQRCTRCEMWACAHKLGNVIARSTRRYSVSDHIFICTCRHKLSYQKSPEGNRINISCSQLAVILMPP